MWWHVFRLVPGLFRNRLVHGRFLDIFITHSPPLGMHDQDDLPHQGIKAFRWLVDSFQPAYYFHGHVHIIGTAENVVGHIGQTTVINSFGFREVEFENSRSERK
jgi:Icc-related predicted phosphoesterase